MWIVVAWLFAVGACIGSFMNVVIYRLPAGLSLLHPPSRCPNCETPIRASDNVPIFGWLWLRGRCRQCKAQISARYPAVELLVALVFVVLALVEPLNIGRILPAAQTKLTQNELWGIYAYHLFLLCSLICAAFTEFDGHGMTKRLAWPAFVVGLAAPMVWPHLRPSDVTTVGADWLMTLLAGIIGGAAGAALGALIVLASKTWRPMGGVPSAKWYTFAVTLAWVGVFLGWKAVLGLGAVAAATHLTATILSRFVPVLRQVGLVGYLTPWVLAWILGWRAIAEALGRL